MALDAIDTGLVGKLAADATLTAAAPGGIWQDEAPQATTGTHIIVSLSASLDVPQFRGTAWEERLYLVKAVGTTKLLADTAAARIKALLDGGTLTVTGYTTMGVWREQVISYVESVGDVRFYHSGGLFRIKVCS